MAEAFVGTIKSDYVRVSARMPRPSCTRYQLGLISTTGFALTRLSDIVHPVSSSQLTEARDRVRSIGGYNTAELVAYRRGNHHAAVPSE